MVVGDDVMSVSPAVRATVTTTSATGADDSATVIVALPPSDTFIVVCETNSDGVTAAGVTTSCGRSADVEYSSDLNVALTLVLAVPRRTNVTEVAPAALSCWRYAVTSNSCHA